MRLLVTKGQVKYLIDDQIASLQILSLKFRSTLANITKTHFCGYRYTFYFLGRPKSQNKHSWNRGASNRGFVFVRLGMLVFNFFSQRSFYVVFCFSYYIVAIFLWPQGPWGPWGPYLFKYIYVMFLIYIYFLLYIAYCIAYCIVY